MLQLSEGHHQKSARDVIRQRLDRIKPTNLISTEEWQNTRRKFKGPTGDIVDFNRTLTPYTNGIVRACDMAEVRVVAVKGNTRSGKTVAAESKVCRHWDVGPLYNVLWFMQDADSVSDYIDERGEDLLKIHPGINEKVNWADRRNSRGRKRIGKSIVFYRAATMRTTRGKAAPIVVADEIDAMQARIRDAILGLVENRQREYGNQALAYFSSHPDAGPIGGIDAILRKCLVHLWNACCPHCGRSAGFAAESPVRFAWNLPEIMSRNSETTSRELARILLHEARLICPHEGCHATFDNAERLKLSNSGLWLQPHQDYLEGNVIGEPLIEEKMGFVIHAFMAPFINIGKVARDFGTAKLEFMTSGNDTDLRDRTVKDLGETYIQTVEEEKTEDWEVVQARLRSGYKMKTVPAGVRVLTQFIDVQGDRFEVRVIGWSEHKESWLIDSYPIKQWQNFGAHSAFDTIDPANRLTDWDLLEETCLMASYPLADNPELFLPIAKTYVNAAGHAGVTKNARAWMSNLIYRDPKLGKRVIEQWKIQNFVGSSSKTGEIYGKPKAVEYGDSDQKLAGQIYERALNVHVIKKIIMRRMKLEGNMPGAMHVPFDVKPRDVQELVSERLLNDVWIKIRLRNEGLDGWVACEAAQATLRLDRITDWNSPPAWCTPKPKSELLDSTGRNQESIFTRLAKVNEDLTK